MDNINQTHNGTGDNVAGNKVTNGKFGVNENTSIPVWAQWVAWFFIFLAFAWNIYTYMYPH